MLITSDHLRAVITSQRLDDQGFAQVGGIRIDYFDTDGLSYIDNISVDEQISLFYSNVAVEELLAKNYDSAFANAEYALQTKSKLSKFMNMEQSI